MRGAASISTMPPIGRGGVSRCATAIGCGRGHRRFAEGWFGSAGGLDGGKRAGLRDRVVAHARIGGADMLGFARRWATGWSGDALALTAGCDRRFATCRDRFGNAANFRGFPHIPGNDFVLRYPRGGRRARRRGRWSDEPRRYGGGGARLARHALSASGRDARARDAIASGCCAACGGRSMATSRWRAALSRRLARRRACGRVAGGGGDAAGAGAGEWQAGAGGAVPAGAGAGAEALRRSWSRRDALHPCAGAARRGRGRI